MRRPTEKSGFGREGQGGFTLIEALIVLGVLGILGAAAVKLLMTQDRFYSRIDHGTMAQQNIRATADLVGAEIRMSGPDDIIAARPDSVSLRFDIYQAVVCDQAGANGAYVFIYDSVPNANIAAGAMVGTAWSGPYSPTYEYADGWTGSMSTGGMAKTTCVANGSPDTTPNSLYRTVTGWTGGFSGVPPRGAIVRRYRQLTYRFAPSNMGGGSALFRGSIELVSPLDPTSAFSYVMANGSVQSNVAPGQLGNIRVVRINAIGIDDDPRFDLQRALQYDIPLRN